jgi:S-adenosyl-L-methionine hydrolase (adenosine-forming)
VTILTLTSDFGLHDPYVGIMKSRIMQRAPQLQIVDLTHDIEPFAIETAGYWLYCVQPQFPAGSVHLAVVDPGVGSERAIVVLEAAGQLFVAPDNGLLGLLGEAWPGSVAYRVEPDVGARLGLPSLSATFHGRDLMAPLAAELASARIAPRELGSAHALRPGRLRAARMESDGALHGTVGVVDRFGNLLTTIPRDAIGQIERPRIQSAGQRIRWVRTYSDGLPGEPIALINSAGMLELAVREGSAAAQLNAGAGEPVVISMDRPSDPDPGSAREG